MSIHLLIESIAPPLGPDISCYEEELFGDDQTRYKNTLSEEDLSVEIPARQRSAMGAYRRLYNKLCRVSRAIVDGRASERARPEDVPLDHRHEAFFHTEPVHYSNRTCGYCLKEILLDVLREGRCRCALCSRVTHRELDRICSRDDCQTVRMLTEVDGRQSDPEVKGEEVAQSSGESNLDRFYKYMRYRLLQTERARLSSPTVTADFRGESDAYEFDAEAAA
jgi:hypothetical protein